MRSTLGEVLLMQGRSHEAYGELERAVRLAPKHPLFDEIRWELALAYLCAGAVDGRPGRSTTPEMDFEGKASDLFKAMREHDEARERPSLTDEQPLERHIASELCASSNGEESSGKDAESNTRPYELQNGAPGADGYALCDQLAIVAYVAGAEAKEAETLRLHVWGPGINVLRPVFLTRVEPQHASLTLPRADTHDLYFAQLERDDAPLSGAYPIETRAKAPCGSNRIVLEFRPGPVKVGEAITPR